MEYLSLIFLHVLFGILWAGGTVIVGFFIVPSLVDAGPAAGPVIAGITKRKMPIAMTVAGLIVVLTGLRLYAIRFTTAWVTQPEGLVLTLGGVLGIGALVIGLFVQRPTAERLGALGAQIAASGAPPTPAQVSEMQALRAKLTRTGKVLAWHLLAAAVLMAFHRLASAL